MSEFYIEEASNISSEHVEPEAIDEDYFIAETTEQELYYHCENCGNHYECLEAYTKEHNGQLGSCCGPNLKGEEVLEADAPLWELIEEEPHVKNEEAEVEQERYFCYDCHSIFENRCSAEEHICPQVENGSADPKKSTRRKVVPPTKDDSAFTQCEICNTKFSSSKSLKFHMRMHGQLTTKSIQDALPEGAHQQYNELDQFYCEICNKSFDENLLEVHKRMHQQQATTEQYKCSICNRQFENVTNYEMHLKMHEKQSTATTTAAAGKRSSSSPLPGSKDKPGFACQYCERVFLRPYEKVKHERVHTGEKPYSCEVCGKTFRVSYSLTLHLRTHTNIRPYVCTICNKRFKSHQVYAHHARIHSSDREYACDMCPKTFRTSVQLYGHKNTHTKPYNCAVCNRPFASLYAVKAHMLNHQETGAATSAKPPVTGHKIQMLNKFCCVICGAEYARLFALRQHMNSAHADQPEVKNMGGSIQDDTEAAVLLAAAEADAAYLQSVVQDVDIVGTVPSYEESTEFQFHSEEIITDWLK